MDNIEACEQVGVSGIGGLNGKAENELVTGEVSD